MIAIVDTGPLYAALDRADGGHAISREVLNRNDLEPVIPTLVVAEVSYLVGTRLGPGMEARFFGGLAELEVESPTVGDWARIAELVEEYSDFQLGGTDASVVALAERLDTDIVITLDRRHFAAVRPRHCEAFTLLPE